MTRSLCCAIVSIFLGSVAPVAAATLTNGSLTGPLATNGVPMGWSVSSDSPDTNDISSATGLANYDYAVTPVSSTNGGTWVGIGADGPGFWESFSQTVTGFIVGESYELNWEVANFGYLTPLYGGDNGIKVLLDGVVIGSGAIHALESAWFHEGITFTATAASQTLTFGLATGTRSYVQIDGIKLEVAAVPLPGAAGLLLAGLGMFGAARGLRRSKQLC